MATSSKSSSSKSNDSDSRGGLKSGSSNGNTKSDKSSSSSKSTSSSSSKSSSKSPSSSKSSGLGGALGGIADSIGKSASGAFSKSKSDVMSRDSKSSSSSRNDSDSRGGLKDKSNAASVKGTTTSRSKTERTKDNDMNPNGPSVARQKEKYSGNAQTIAETLADAGWKDHQIAGALGRLQQESSLNPRAVRKDDAPKSKIQKDSIGIGQWNDVRGADLKAFAAQRSKDWRDLKTQAQFVAHEMATSKHTVDARKAMNSAKTVQEAATAMMHYERPRGYSRKNPAGGHGYQNTQTYAAAFDAGRGLRTVAGVDNASLAVAASSTASQNLQRNPQAETSYVDPGLVSRPRNAGTSAIETQTGQPVKPDNILTQVVSGAREAIHGIENIGNKNPTPMAAAADQPRQGFGAIGESLAAGNLGTALKQGFKAIRDPIGFGIDTIEDAYNQYEQGKNDFGLGFLDNLSLGGGTAISNAIGKGDGNNSSDRNPVNGGGSLLAAAIPIDQIAAIVPPTPAVTPAKRQPFGWSTLNGSTKTS